MKKGIIVSIIFIMFITSVLLFYFFIQQDDQSEYEVKLLEFKQQVRDDLKKYNMIQRIKPNRGVLEPKTNFTNIERLSHYQTFVTPTHPAVINYIQTNEVTTINDAYTKAVYWTWVSDTIMHGVAEKWLKPKEFIIFTSNHSLYPQNPVNSMASDCESQAYTLVSILEAIGIPKENVRVCIGLVDFGSGPSGHAWVQLYESNIWYELEATTGPYWDEDINQLVNSSGVELEYFKTRPYPVEEYWAFFNDVYYYNPSEGVKTSTLPSHWMTTEKQFTLSEVKNAIKIKKSLDNDNQN